MTELLPLTRYYILTHRMILSCINKTSLISNSLKITVHKNKGPLHPMQYALQGSLFQTQTADNEKLTIGLI